MIPKHVLIFSILFLSFASSEKFSFDNYVLYKVLPKSDDHYKILQNIHDTDLRYDFWSSPAPLLGFVSVMSSPQDKGDLEDILESNGIQYEIAMQNIQEAIKKETVDTYRRSSNTTMRWDAYYNLNDTYAWLDAIAAAYPSIVTIVSAGRSYEGQDMKGVRISHGSGRKAIFVEGGLHAREWITVTCSCFIINELLTSTDAEIRAAARDYEWHIFPITNPDGYLWSHVEFRMWRKNRRPVGTEFGVDLNRNWNNNWLVAGASTNPAAITYAGPGPFSEPETRSLSNYLRSISDRLDLYLSMHSFSELLLVPFGNSTAPYSNYFDAVNIGRRAMGALSVRYGTQYTTGNIAEAIYMATGGSIDWVKERLQVPLVYCYELRDRGQYGFLLPEEQILPNNQEVMDSLIELIHQAKRFGYMNNANGVQVSIFTMVSAFIAVFLRN